MRPRTAILSLPATLAILMAEPAAAENIAQNMVAAAREAALEKILAERGSPEALAAAIAAARKAGVGEQAILEARFLYHVDRREDRAIAAMLPDFLKQRDSFKLEDSSIFGVKEDWLAVVEYAQALAALGRDDKAAFKKHITEAFWLSPRQAAAFAPNIERLRLDDCMRALRIDFSVKPAALSTGEPVALGGIIKGKKAMLLHFWSPWSRECEASMPDFIATAGLLTDHDIAVVSLLADDPGQLSADARAMIRPHVGKPAGAWLIDPKSQPLARELRVRNLPTMVLVSTEGTILFNGDPAEAGFWEALKKIDSRLARPESNRAE